VCGIKLWEMLLWDVTELRMQMNSKKALITIEEIFYAEGGETLARVAQRGGRCPIPGNIQGKAGRGSEQPD